MIQVNAYRPGTYVRISGIPGESHKLWYILSTHIELLERDMSYDMTQNITILAVDDNAEDIGKEPITLMSDNYDIVEL